MGLETRYYVDAAGNYLGGFSVGNPAIPRNAVEISLPPDHGWQKYGNGEWLPLTEDQMAHIKEEDNKRRALFGVWAE